MRRSVAAVAVAALVVGCADVSQPPTVTVPLYGSALNASENANGGNFGTPISPDEEVMPAGVVNTSNAVGNAVFHLSEDGTELSYKLIVANIENVFQAHIHRAVAGVNGPIVVWLYPSTAPVAGPLGGGRIQGVIAEGTITAANFVGPLAGQPISALLDLLANGGAYVNAHTNDGVAPTNTGPGDFPGGELRGQVEARGQRQ
jgi:CHRD domain-containing protein